MSPCPYPKLRGASSLRTTRLKTVIRRQGRGWLLPLEPRPARCSPLPTSFRIGKRHRGQSLARGEWVSRHYDGLLAELRRP